MAMSLKFKNQLSFFSPQALEIFSGKNLISFFLFYFPVFLIWHTEKWNWKKLFNKIRFIYLIINNNTVSFADLRVRHRWTLHEDLCYHWLVDECSWPQCNRACPRLHDPFTGEELDFIELLKSFGLDMASVASALGIDMVTLNDMDHDTLLQLLTQQTN